MMKGNQTLSCVCDPQGVGNGRTTYPRVFGATPLDLWLGNGHPQGVPTPIDPSSWWSATTDPYRRMTDPEATTSYRPEDPARDPRFIATGRAATAAMTCGQINVLTSTPCGSPGKRISARRPARGRGGRDGSLYIGHCFADDRCLWSEHPSGASRMSPLGI